MYNKIASIYDALMNEDINYEKWCIYIKDMMDKHHGNIDNILDMGCGTGNITIPLSKIGYNMTGVDISEEMLAIADSKAFTEKQNIMWVHHDMVDFCIPNTYDAVISCCDAVNYILDDDELDLMFANVYESIREGGVFLFDVQSYYNISSAYGDNTFTYTSNNLSYIWENHFDKETDIIEYYLNFFVKNNIDDYYTRIEEVHLQRAYHLNALKDKLYKEGFKSVKAYGFNSFNKPSKKDKRLQFFCVK